MTDDLVRHVDPPALYRSPAYAAGMVAAAGPTLYVGGQNGRDAQGNLVDGLEAQTEQAMRNLMAVLDAAGSSPEHVVKLHVYLVAGSDVNAAFAASRAVWGEHRTAITVVLVAGLGPAALVEIDAIAVIP